MPEFLIKSPHTAEECLKALDDTLALGADVLAKFEYGCLAGDHTAYGSVQASGQDEARALVPHSLRDRATVVEVAHFSPEQIRQLHEKVA